MTEDEERQADEVNIAFQMGAEWQKKRSEARIKQLEAELQKIADIEHEDLPKPSGSAEGTLWAILAGCVEVAEAALEGKKDE